jgi:hypothetical protein
MIARSPSMRERGRYELEAGHPGHAYVGEHEPRSFSRWRASSALMPRVAGGDLEPARAQELAERGADHVLVVDDEDPPHRGLGDGADGAGQSGWGSSARI